MSDSTPHIQLIEVSLIGMRKCQHHDGGECSEAAAHAGHAQVAVEEVEEAALRLVAAGVQVPEIETEAEVRDDHETEAQEDGENGTHGNIAPEGSLGEVRKIGLPQGKVKHLDMVLDTLQHHHAD